MSNGEQPIRKLELQSAVSIEDDVPSWAWERDGKGRIALATLAIFAGRPGAGKSTGARWIIADASNGTLPGCWEGTPVNTAYLGAEESAKYIVKPGCRGAGADLNRVFFPKVTFDGEEVKFLSGRDMADLTDALLAKQVKVVVVDPLMSTIGSKTDVNRNNEVRSLIEPWAKLAEAIDGIVIGIAHLNKSGNGDVVAGINGSSAFGEVARAVFGFAKDPESDGDRIMSQEKNSLGDEDLALTYRIESTLITTDSGRSAEVGRFVITGDADRSVGDVLRDAGGAPSSGNSEVRDWLFDYLTENSRTRSKDAKTDGAKEGFSRASIERAATKLKVVSESEGFPRITYWSLPAPKETIVLSPEDYSVHSTQSPHPPAQSPAREVTEVTEVTGADLQGHGEVTGAKTQSPHPRDSEVTGDVAVISTAYSELCRHCGTRMLMDSDRRQGAHESCQMTADAKAADRPKCPTHGEPIGRTGKCVGCVADAARSRAAS